MGTTSCIIIKQKLFIFHHLHYCANRKNNKSKNSFISQIFLFSNRNCCDSKHFVSKYFYLNEKIFLAWHFLDECNAGDRRMIDVTDGGRAGPHPQSQIDWRSTTILDEERIQAWNIGIDQIYFHKIHNSLESKRVLISWDPRRCL